MMQEPEHVRRAREATRKHKPASPPAAKVPDGEDDKERLSNATKITRFALASDIKLFHSPDQIPLVALETGEHRETYAVDSTAFRRWLSRLYYQATKKAASSNAIADALAILAANAIHDGDEIVVETRVAQSGDMIYLDLADEHRRAVEITRDGWRVVARSPIMFIRPSGMYRLPEPQRGGSVEALRPFVNTKDDAGFRLVVSYLVAALRPGRPFPVLYLRGEQGSAKSTLARLLRALIDPNKAPLRRPPRDDRDLVIAASNGWIVGYDNLSHIPEWLSDGLCCLATGTGFGTRTLFTNNEETLFQAMRPIMLTSIEEVVTRGDLLDRCLAVELEPIPDHKRRTESEIEAEFQQVHGFILGALLDAAAAALKRLPTTRLSSMPRMADFAQWVTAAEAGLGWDHGSFMADYAGNREQCHDAILTDSLIYEPLLRVLEAHGGKWTGTSAELLELLAAQAGEKSANQRTWPAKPNALTNRLKRVAPALRAIGISVEQYREPDRQRKRMLVIRRHANDRPGASESSDATGSHAFAGDWMDDPAHTDIHADDASSPCNDRFSDASDHSDDSDGASRSSHDGPYGERI